MTVSNSFELPRLICRTSNDQAARFDYAVLAITPAFVDWFTSMSSPVRGWHKIEGLTRLVFDRIDVLCCDEPRQLAPMYLQDAQLDDLTALHTAIDEGVNWARLPAYCATPTFEYAPNVCAPTTQVSASLGGAVRFTWFDPDGRRPTEITTPWLERQRVINLSRGVDEMYDPNADPKDDDD